MPKYENSVIYKLKHNEDYDDTNIYVGSTTNFKNRKYSHNRRCNNEKDQKYHYIVYKYIRANSGWENLVMIPIEPYPCNSKKELEIRERHYIDILRPKLNIVKPGRTKKEYYEDNKEKILEKAKEYYEDNKEHENKRSKKYREDNKEKIAEYLKKYREADKEQTVERDKKYYENNKKKVICEHCNCEIIKSYLTKHQKTKKCLKSQEDNVSR